MKKYWFVRKLYGYGWMPSSKEGWFVILLAAIIVIYAAVNLENNPVFGYTTIILTGIALISVCYKTGESLKWQWGKRKE